MRGGRISRRQVIKACRPQNLANRVSASASAPQKLLSRLSLSIAGNDPSAAPSVYQDGQYWCNRCSTRDHGR
jgi:hypothetical protein